MDSESSINHICGSWQLHAVVQSAVTRAQTTASQRALRQAWTTWASCTREQPQPSPGIDTAINASRVLRAWRDLAVMSAVTGKRHRPERSASQLLRHIHEQLPGTLYTCKPWIAIPAAPLGPGAQPSAAPAASGSRPPTSTAIYWIECKRLLAVLLVWRVLHARRLGAVARVFHRWHHATTMQAQVADVRTAADASTAVWRSAADVATDELERVCVRAGELMARASEAMLPAQDWLDAHPAAPSAWRNAVVCMLDLHTTMQAWVGSVTDEADAGMQHIAALASKIRTFLQAASMAETAAAAPRQQSEQLRTPPSMRGRQPARRLADRPPPNTTCDGCEQATATVQALTESNAALRAQVLAAYTRAPAPAARTAEPLPQQGSS